MDQAQLAVVMLGKLLVIIEYRANLRFFRVEECPVLNPNFRIMVRARFEFITTVLGEVDEGDFIRTRSLVDLLFDFTFLVLFLLVDSKAGMVKCHCLQELVH